MDTSRSSLRLKAYKYILERLSKLGIDYCDIDSLPNILLDEIRLIKEGTADPSSALAASLKRLMRDIVDEREIENYLVKPFEQHEL
ncbi:hypothetical protein ACFLWM_01280 [Chloroflexota bacterium]